MKNYSKIRITGNIAIIFIMLILNLACTSNILAFENKTISQKDFDIAVDSPADQTSNIQKYLNEIASQGGGTAYLQPGYYTIKGSLTIPTGVILAGSWSAPHHGIISKGTVLHAYGGRGKDTGPALLELVNSSGVRGITIYYPQQRIGDIQPYPWTIHGIGMHATIENITLVNSYQGISFGPKRNSLHFIHNVYGCVLRYGIKIDQCYDIGRIENVNFVPHYWARSGAVDFPHKGNPARIYGCPPVARYTQKHLEAFVFGKTDLQKVTNTFVFSAKVGYRFTGICSGQFTGIAADRVQYSIIAEAGHPGGIVISNSQFITGIWEPLKKEQQYELIGLHTTPSFKGSLIFSNCSFFGWHDNIMKLEGNGYISFANGLLGNRQPCDQTILITNGRAKIAQSHFYASKNTADVIEIGKDVTKVDLLHNSAINGIKITNHAGDKLKALHNNTKQKIP